MQDLGGCRLIFKTLADLNEFREYLDNRSRAHHILSHTPSKYDYISAPKQTGYRGVHYVYKYAPTTDSRREFSGLKVEVQLRTAAQHAWATAVEISDLVFGTRTKFEDGSGDNGEFFRLASELIARRHEGMVSCCSELSFDEVAERFLEIEKRVDILDRLAKLREQGDFSRIKQHTILAFMQDSTLEIFGYTKAKRAIDKEGELLHDTRCANVVYVSASSPTAIRSSYRNYLTNPEDFVKLVKDALQSRSDPDINTDQSPRPTARTS